MKTFETEKNNIPEGATHYSDEAEGDCFAWYKVLHDVPFIWCVGYEEEWIKMIHPSEFEGGGEVKPIPQTKKVEWVNGDECLFTDKSGDTKTCKVIGLYPPFVESYVLHCESANPTFFISNMGRMVKPETPEQKLARERIENGKAFYELMSEIETSVMHPSKHGKPNDWEEMREEWQQVYILQAEKLSYKAK
ncbi:putative coil containing protein [Vibrio phage 193E37-1]|nr:putative coil containing protein [Vibrio phage 193E37-1]